MRVILNRDLHAACVPAYRVASLLPSGHGHEAAWVAIRRFALSFDAAAYTEATGRAIDAAQLLERARNDYDVELDLVESRAALAQLWHETSGLLDYEDAVVADSLLDAIYEEIAPGRQRPQQDPLFEPPLGMFGKGIASGQHRFEIRSGRWNREELFAAVAGLIHLSVDAAVTVSALFLHPPAYPDDPADPPSHIFMLLLEPRAESRISHELLEWHYGYVVEAVVAEIAERVSSGQEGDRRFAVPEKLSLEVSTGGHFELVFTWEIDRLRVVRNDSTSGTFEPRETREVRPSDAQLRQFWREAHAVRVWDWEANYEDNSTTDGTWWRLHLQLAGRSASSSGYNAFPVLPDYLPPAMSIPPEDARGTAFARLCRAAEELARKPGELL